MTSKKSDKKQKVKAIILMGNRDFGRCSMASYLSPSLWPLGEKTILERLLVHLADQGVKRVVICSNINSAILVEKIQTDSRLKIEFSEESLPVGTAGCIRDAVGGETDELLLIFPASLISPPKVDMLINSHRDAQSDLTVFINPSNESNAQMGQASGIYVCDPVVLERIPKGGYFDIKEGLIPKMIRDGKNVPAVELQNGAGNFRDWQGYLYAVSNSLEHNLRLNEDLKPYKNTNSQAVLIGTKTKIDQTARIYGPVTILNSTTISKGVVIFGPTIIGSNVNVGKDSVVVNSMIWDGVRIGSDCRIQRCVVDYNAVIQTDTNLEEQPVLFESKGVFRNKVSEALEMMKGKTSRLQSTFQPQLARIYDKSPVWLQTRKRTIIPFLAGCLILIAFCWSYWPGFMDLWNIWQRSDEYSSGLLVPFLAAYILWSRRHDITQCRIKPSLLGLIAFVAAQAFRFFGLFFMYSSAERLSIVLSIAALVLFLFGWRLFLKVSTVMLYLCLMLPWPYRITQAVTLPLQEWATSSAVFGLEMLGKNVIREGNIITIGQATVAVAEACNGLRMITAFFVISGLVVLLVKRTWWEKLIILVSSLPIALLCNTIRLIVTSLFFTVLEGEYWEKLFHDFGGYAMMPLALVAIIAELWLVTKLTIIPEKEATIIITRQNGYGNSSKIK